MLILILIIVFAEHYDPAEEDEEEIQKVRRHFCNTIFMLMTLLNHCFRLFIQKVMINEKDWAKRLKVYYFLGL